MSDTDPISAHADYSAPRGKLILCRKKPLAYWGKTPISHLSRVKRPRLTTSARS